jgi:signal transduction histidine kinase
MELFGAGEGCVATIAARGGSVQILYPTAAASDWDRGMLAEFLRGGKVRVPEELMLARIRRHGRMWGVLAVRANRGVYHWDARQAFSTLGSVANELIEEIDQERVREVRLRVDRKVLEQSLPKHLFYEILHGLKSLTTYDHSAALLLHDRERGALEVVAEKVAWQKAKGQHVGRLLALGGGLQEKLIRGEVHGFSRNGAGWVDWTGTDATELAELLDYGERRASGQVQPREGAILCAPLVSRSGLLGVLKVAAVAPESFGNYEVELVREFLPQAAVALQNARRTEHLREQVLAAERKHAMADLARGVAHDVNNALGAVLPLVQQLQEELREGVFEAAVAGEDLREIERSIQVCRRIFGGMLSFARGSMLNASEVSLRHAVDCALAILRQGMESRGVVVEVAIPEDLRMLSGVQADVEQLLLNLISNARDATGQGGVVRISAEEGEECVVLAVADTGCGMTRELLERVQEPFFTTKADGHGLGLAVCRSIVAQMRGRLSIWSEPGAGTRVEVVLPVMAGEEPA